MKTNRLLIMISLLIYCQILILGCGNNSETSPSTEETTSEDAFTVEENEKGSMHEEFYRLIQNEKDHEVIYSFFEHNISATQQDDADKFVLGLIEIEDNIRNVDFKRIQLYTDYMSTEMNSFVNFMAKEQDSPSIENGQIQESLADLLSNIRDIEILLTTYPDGITLSYAYDLYCEMMTAAVTGGYDEKSGKDNYYISSDKEHVDGHAIDAYNAFITENPDTKTAVILKKYIDTLGNSKKTIDDGVKDFYANLFGTIREEFGIEQ